MAPALRFILCLRASPSFVQYQVILLSDGGAVPRASFESRTRDMLTITNPTPCPLCCIVPCVNVTVCCVTVQKLWSACGQEVKWAKLLDTLTITGHDHQSPSELHAEISDRLPLLNEVSYDKAVPPPPKNAIPPCL